MSFLVALNTISVDFLVALITISVNFVICEHFTFMKNLYEHFIVLKCLGEVSSVDV